MKLANPAVSYTYDPAGNKLSQTDATGTTRYAYDPADRRLSASSTSGSFLYTYDQAGNLLSRTYPNGLKTAYGYDSAGQLATATVNGKKTYYTHDANGKLASTVFSNGILETRSYDAAGQLKDLSAKTSDGKPFYSRSYSYDAVGNPTQLIAKSPRNHSEGWLGKLFDRKREALASWKETYSYDSRDRLTRACMNESCSRFFSYAYDPVGNRTVLQIKKSKTSYSYDASDEVLSASKLEHGEHRPDVTTYAYDQNGNETRSGDTIYSYDLANELIEVKKGCDKISYFYSGEGLMAQRATKQEITTYAWDESSDLAQLATETTTKNRKNETVVYTYADGPQGVISGSNTFSFHTDALRSVVELTDSSGRSVQSYRYSPYGEDYGSGTHSEAEAETSNALRYTGQYLDSESDLYYLRAREYEPETGRFLETDPLQCDLGGSCGSAYAYVDERPTVEVDPSGEGAMGASFNLWAMEQLGQNHRLAPKRVFATFFPERVFTTPLVPGKFINRAANWWDWERVSSHNDWRICWYLTRTCNGVISNRWVYDEQDHGTDDAKLMRLASEWDADHSPSIGYSYVVPRKNWYYKDPSGVHVTRHFLELYNTSKADPAGFPGWQSRMHQKPGDAPAVAVRLSDLPFSASKAGQYVFKVCRKMSTPNLSIYSELNMDHDQQRINKIALALDECSVGYSKYIE